MPRYHRLISEFESRTGVPIILNTSFNENEPIVMTPREAISTFLEDEDGRAGARELRRPTKRIRRRLTYGAAAAMAASTISSFKARIRTVRRQEVEVRERTARDAAPCVVGDALPFLDIRALETAVARVCVVEDPDIALATTSLEQDAIELALVRRPARPAARSRVFDIASPRPQDCPDVVEVLDSEEGRPRPPGARRCNR